jgi:hypothetical protein
MMIKLTFFPIGQEFDYPVVPESTSPFRVSKGSVTQPPTITWAAAHLLYENRTNPSNQSLIRDQIVKMSQTGVARAQNDRRPVAYRSPVKI